MIIRRKQPRPLGLDEPLRHESHRRPVTRRDFLAQGFVTGSATIIAPTLLGLLASNRARAALSSDIQALTSPANCNIQNGAGKVPFIAIDLAGGANIAGSNVYVGQDGNQMNFLSTAGYSKLGLPGSMIPATSTPGAFIDTSMGIAFHSDSAFLRGMQMRMSPEAMARVNGVIIAARSENDTQNNPHNPMYGIARAGARGSLVGLIGSQSSDSGGNSMSPAAMINAELRPTKVDRPTDATGLVDTGQLGTLLPSKADTVSVMESIARVSEFKLGRVSTGLPTSPVDEDAAAEKLVRCSYVKTAYQAENFGTVDVVNPRSTNDVLVGASTPASIFTTAEVTAEREFDKITSIAKLVVEGFAGAGTASMGGYDYHTGERATGEMRDLRAGQCMGACLEYAHRKGKPLMLYVFSDGSLSSNGAIDNSVGGRGKGQWTGDNQSTAASLILVYNPTGRPTVRRNQIGSYSAAGDVINSSSPAANAVNLLVETVILNYMALHGEEGNFQTLFPTTGLSTAQMDMVLALTRITP